MKLYYDPVSTTSRPICLMVAEAGIVLETQIVSLMTGETQEAWFRAINPLGHVPVLVDGDFVLTESAAILKYIAGHHASQFYPAVPRARARVDEAVSWFSTDVHLWFDVMTVYPSTLLKVEPELATAMAELARPHVDKLLDHLDATLSRQANVAGEERSIADYLAISFLTLAELIDFDFARWPAIVAWIAKFKCSAHWGYCFGGFYGLAAALRPPSPG